jgi:outer membrane protein assembly factor BamB
MLSKISGRTVVIGLLIVAGLMVLIWWIGKNPVAEFTESLPGTDNRISQADSIFEVVNIGEYFEGFGNAPDKLTESWPRFRGEDFDNVSKSPVKLIDRFNGRAPEILWSYELGEGHAGPAIYKGAVYLLDYDEEKRADMLRCFPYRRKGTMAQVVWR